MRSLKLIKILDFYDVPEVFIASDVLSTKYMCLRNSFSEEEGFIYIAVQISTDRLDDYISKRVDLRSLFVYPEADNSYFKVTVHAEKISAFPILSIEDFNIPEEGYYYEEDEDVENINLITETQQKGHTILRLGFIDENNTHEIDAECLAQAISSFQKTVSHCHQKLFGKQKAVEAKLNVTAFQAASFDVEFRSYSPTGLFGDSDLCETLKKIDSLMKVPDVETFKLVAQELSGRTISSYHSFINIINENKLSIKYKWVSSIADSEVVSSHISATKIETIHNLLESNQELESEINEYDGIFLASSVENGKWTLKIEGDSPKNISGGSENKSILSGIIIEQQRYHIKCRESIIQNVTTLKTDNKTVLIDLAPI